ncbi:hypothetical protein AYR54_03870 [Loigolactobacillus backii]|uniref:hypothetical protein n=1 Tax=Loigolactobacillus backii TaxID=375175 RepID=UPI0007F0BE3C|nr:hypothetical protein [Loigolactobacillus backii]ANK59455.1 hypothetical protein AYR52_03860 [Loigolactobacillus backii]ANK64448.1 hypothetical protein AYR54_03870 [Loigolactobacillus backii]ANK67156.1 hypothetical protein AYR55_05165 [Loigolactobacillus backii]OLF69499.1 hypothetical protein ACX53_07620 [Loigolactobacillus backii]PIO87801.1 hypothetical protein B8A32_11920 [Loigolactobacillus backii]
MTTDSDGVAIISEKTNTDASVTTGITHTTKANLQGRFKVSYNLVSPKKKTVNITVTKDGTTATDSVIVKPSHRFIAKKNKLKIASSKRETAMKTSTSHSRTTVSNDVKEHL